MGTLEMHGVDDLQQVLQITKAEDALVRGQETACWIQYTLENSEEAQSLLHLMAQEGLLRERLRSIIDDMVGKEKNAEAKEAPKEKTPHAVGNYIKGKLGERNLI